jgi:hypothetical protein
VVERIAGTPLPQWPTPGPARVTEGDNRTDAVDEHAVNVRRALEGLFHSAATKPLPSSPRATSVRAEELTPHLGRFVDVIA